MQKKSLLNLISILLIVSFSIIIPLNTSYALYPKCNTLNKYGQFDDETCAIVDSINKISNGKKFIKLNNVGKNSEYDLLFFDASEVNGILPNLTYVENMDEIITERKNQLTEINKATSTGIYALGLGGTLLHILNGHRLLNYGNLFLITITTGISALLSNIACSINSYFSNKNTNKILETSIVERNNYFDTLELLLKHLDYNELNSDKILCLRLKSSPAIVRILNKNSSGDITLYEQNKFDDDIKKLKEDITSILHDKDELR